MNVRLRAVFVCLLVCTLICPSNSNAYAVLAHEAIIDAVWETHIKPLLLARFPGSTEEQLSEAQAYAYGGAAIRQTGCTTNHGAFFLTLTRTHCSGEPFPNFLSLSCQSV